MNAKIKQYQLLLALEEKKFNEALLNYTKANQIFIEAKEQHKKLIAYQAEYGKTLASKNSMQAHTLGVYHEFIDKLDQAINEQEQKIIQAKEKADVLFGKYLEIKKKSDGLEKLLEKEKANELVKQAKQEQKQYDESASAQWYQDKDSRH